MAKKLERAISFIDGSNFYRNMKDVGIPISGLDYSLLSKKLCGSRELLQVRFYVGPVKQGDDEKSKALYKGQRKFFSVLEKQDNVELLLGRIEKRGEGVWVEKAVDVMIATDMVSMAYEDAYDVAYLLSADGDFTPAVEVVRARGKKVFVASPAPGYEISKVANTFILLKREFFNDCWVKHPDKRSR